MQLRVKFKKTGRAVYISHLDLMRTWERVLRRADWKLAFSAGFNPHPKMSFAQALSLGMESYAEYMDVELAFPIDLTKGVDDLNAALPEGLEVVKIGELAEKEKTAMSLVTASRYSFVGDSQESLDKWENAIKELQGRSEIIIMRDGKKGLKEMEIRELLLELKVEKKDEKIVVDLLASTGSRGNLRPQEVLQALEKYENVKFADYELERAEMYKSVNGEFVPLI